MVDLSKMTKWDLGKCFDHSVLPKNTTEADIRSGCEEAIKYNCAAFYPSTNYWLPVTTEMLKGTGVLAATTFDFPFGTGTPTAKGYMAEEAVKLGAQAIDMVMNIGALKSGHIDTVKEELKNVKSVAGNEILTKCIMDVNFLTDDEIRTATGLIVEAGLDYAKTSSGQFDGPSMEQFLIMKEVCKGTGVKLKVAGVKFPRPQNAYAFLMAGADLIGTRAAIQIINAFDQMREIGLVPKYQG